ncbi:MAG TPA: DUF2075 domain-containing protein [Thermoanaerobaculia bacterium]
MQPGKPSRAWYASSIEGFCAATTNEILGALTAHTTFSVLETQRDAWKAQIEFLRERLRGLTGSVFFEFNIPRMGRRIDVVLLTGGVVFVIEFKVGAAAFDSAAVDQVWDYALDLKNFHEGSHSLTIVPLLVVPDAVDGSALGLARDADGVVRPLKTNRSTFREAIDRASAEFVATRMDADLWAHSSYRPTPTIIEAARALYAQHSVEEIARHDAGAENLRVTSQHIEELVDEAKRTRRKIVCFVTGVPGAGKTLVGLNVATRRNDVETGSPAVYLSGNAPLVAVLREALTRDEVKRQQDLGLKASKKSVGGSVKAFVQNVHHLRDEAIRDPKPPIEHVAIFDEAQRAWTREKAESWMRRKKNIPDFTHSEPEFLLQSMDRHTDWSVVICLVGGGQEINDGEAGIDEWLHAVNTRFGDWRMHISSRLTDSEYAAGGALDLVRHRPQTHFDDSLHLAVSMRSFRAENVSAFVKAVLDRERRAASAALEQMEARYPMIVTRDLDAAKEWVRTRARGSERYGLVTSSKAFRLKPHAIDVRVNIDPVHWFLSEKEDTRSSYYLEDAATEFQVQGLELDWTCVTWDADLRLGTRGWSFHDFRGSRWQNVNKPENQRYLLNAYRVLLTRARQGMAIFIPPGNRSDPTRTPEFYDSTFQYLKDVGVPVLG